jgi:FKBP-type peptidyl-prolyl cis-trans isomerase
MKKIFYCLIITATFLASCKSDRESLGKWLKTDMGYDYVFYDLGDGRAAQAGDFVVFSLLTTTDREILLQNYSSEAMWPFLQIPPEGENPENNFLIDVMRKVKEGDSLHFRMPIDSAQARISTPIPGDEYMEYQIRIMKILNEQEYGIYSDSVTAVVLARQEQLKGRVPAIAGQMKNLFESFKAGDARFAESESGLVYYIIESGNGENYVTGDEISTLYHGILADGTVFNSTFERAQEYKFSLGTYLGIEGLTEAYGMLSPGAKAYFVIPPDLGYGQEMVFNIPPNSTLYFYIETL